MIHWGAPQILYGLIFVAALGWVGLLLIHWREKKLRRLMDDEVLARFLPEKRIRWHYQRLVLWLFALALGTVALARPQWGEKWVEVRHMGLDILVVLDTSNSMRAEDIRPNRLGRAKLGIQDLTRKLQGDRIGLIPFAGSSYLFCPLTADYPAFLMMLDDVRPGLIPRGGTAIEQALRLAINSFDDDRISDRVILLITDGEDHEGNPLNLVDTLRNKGIRVFAVGVGTPEGDLIPMTDERGQTFFMRDREGSIVRTRLQEDVLERLATRTGGMYIRATATDFGLERIYEEGIAPLQRELMESEMILVHEERFVLFLAVALILLFIESMIPVRFQANRNRAALHMMMGLLFLSTPLVTEAESPRRAMERGQHLYQAGEYEQAAEAFRQAAAMAPENRLDPAPAYFNAGNALFRQGLFQEAARVYQNALMSLDPTVQQRTFFNRGNALLRKAQKAVQTEQWRPAKELIDKALEDYRNVLTLNPANKAAKINHEIADKLREELEELIAQQPPAPAAPPDADPQNGDEKEDDEASPEPTEEEEEREGEADIPADIQPDERDESSHDDAQSDFQSAQMEEMTEEEAMLLLDMLRDEEQETRDQMNLQLGPPEEVEKDW